VTLIGPDIILNLRQPDGKKVDSYNGVICIYFLTNTT